MLLLAPFAAAETAISHRVRRTASSRISKLVFTILSAVAEAERDRIRERIADVKRDQKTRGRFLGGSRPFGWQIAADGSLEPLESERKALLAMRRMQKAGKSLRTIATAMQERGFAISHQGVKKALTRWAHEETC